MFNRSNQFIFYINAVIAVFGILIALLTGFVVIGLIFSACALLLIYVQIRQNRFVFTISDLKKILTIHDTGGNKATQTQMQITTACHTDNTEYWFKNIRATGSVSNFRINGSDPAEQRLENGSYQVCMKLPPELKAIDGFDVTLSVDYDDAFTKSEGLLTHVVADDTRQLSLTVELPKGRPVSSARFYCIHDGREEALLPPVVTRQTRIEANIADPILGAEYCLQWNWPEDGVMQKISRLF